LGTTGQGTGVKQQINGGISVLAHFDASLNGGPANVNAADWQTITGAALSAIVADPTAIAIILAFANDAGTIMNVGYGIATSVAA
jgi:hypothetical protein